MIFHGRKGTENRGTAVKPQECVCVCFFLAPESEDGVARLASGMQRSLQYSSGRSCLRRSPLMESVDGIPLRE